MSDDPMNLLDDALRVLEELVAWLEWKPDDHPGELSPYVGDIANRARKVIRDAEAPV